MAQTLKDFRLNLLIFVVTFPQLIFLSCAHYGDWAKRIDWEELDFADLPGTEEYPETGAIILLNNGSMEIVGDDKIKLSIFERHQIIKILNPRGHQYANIVIQYDSQSNVEQIQARTISADGKITVLDPKNIYDINLYPNFIFFSDQRAKLFTLPAVENGSIIEYRYQINISGFTLRHYWNFQEEVPTLLSRFTLIAPSEWDVNHQVYGIDLKPTIIKTPLGFKSTYTWEARDIPALKSEFGMPSKNDLTAHLALAPIGIKTWKDVVQWYYELSNPQLKAGKKVKELVHTLTDGIENDDEKLQIIYEWVRDQIRYISVSIGIGGYQPHPAEEVFFNRYGDCKDMTTLLCSMTREVGIDAYEVLVSTWQNGKPDTNLPSPLHFNHVIAYCPSAGNNGIWMDATDKSCPYGKLPWYDQGLPVLVIDEDTKGKIIKTPFVPPDSNHTNIEWKVDLEPTGTAIIQGNTKLWGASASELRKGLHFTSSDERRHWLEVYLAKRCSGAKLDSFQFSDISKINDPLSFRYTFHTTSFTIQEEGEIILRPENILMFDFPSYFRSPERVHPIQFLFGSRKKFHLEINLGDYWKWETSISSNSITSKFGRASCSFKTENKTILLDVEYTLNGKQVAPEQYTDFQNFLDSINDKIFQTIILSKK